MFATGLTLGLWICLCGFESAVGRRVYDLTHTLDNNNPKYPAAALTGKLPNFNYFKSNVLSADYNAKNIWIAIRSVEFYEHIGTHVDAPSHFGKGRPALHEVPADQLIGSGVVIDVKDKVAKNPDYAVTVQDIKDHEKKYGVIKPHSIVFMNSGWDKKFPDPAQVFGSKNLSYPATFHYPGFSKDACKMLLTERQVFVVGVDSPSTDPAQSSMLDCHVLLQNNDVLLIENAAKLDSIPPRNTTILVGAPKFKDSTGSPIRLLAFVDDDDNAKCGSQAVICSGATGLIITIIMTVMHSKLL